MKLFESLILIALGWRAVDVAARQTKISVTGPLTGVNMQTGAAPARMEINEIYAQGGPIWDLYVQALAELQAVDEDDELSYFQIMGIHGLPFQGWNGVGQVPGGADLAGMCPHDELLFGTWHRPFIALYEQTLVSHALNISARYMGDDEPIYRTAAETLRVAYWDWASNATLPAVVNLNTLTINSPTGPTTIRNPFHHYSFQNFPFTIQYMDAGILSTTNHTTRCPNAAGVDDVAAVNAGLETSAFKSQVYNVFTTVQDFQNMETTHYQTSSFESPHNNVHNSVGCSNGTMYDLNWSAFDPIFMLHHANLDRLIAIWQAIYPNSSIFDITDFEGALYGTAAGTVSANTPLKPFYNQDSSFHTSNSVRKISTFGYTYPELQLSNADNTYVSPDDLADFVRVKVNSLYSGEPATYNSEARRRYRSKRSSPWSRNPPARKAWSVAISVDKSELPLPATVGCYLGEKLVGKMALLAIPAMGVTHSMIPLDAALSAARLDLSSEDCVIGYLNQTLRFEVQELKNTERYADHEAYQGDGTPIQIDSVPSLGLVVQDQDFTPRQSDREFPTYGAVNKHLWKAGGRD
ncbi:hypothetical protein VMCG_03309 [Cytospora schulzeri]|uniref:Tyrosinase copper-binding domain-containing protein n=1 Tax=Cytospora schulzeri TaxID=448051 RepID=A0A423WXH4_9PEZI|nr:hypothetical protein VMCG_03309 [Valsa malicola]